MVRAPLSDYIRSSLDLRLGSQVPGARLIELEDLAPDEIDFLVERAFESYFNEVALLGSVDKAVTAVDRFRAIGVDEVACLIDFGVPAPLVLSGLEYLNRLRKLSLESLRL
jgi:hypothetical protein